MILLTIFKNMLKTKLPSGFIYPKGSFQSGFSFVCMILFVISCFISIVVKHIYSHTRIYIKKFPPTIVEGSYDPDGNRTRVTAVNGRCLNRLTTGPDIPALYNF